ncbi:MAG: hypothetical protein J2P41_24120 [Blastocatellia bacterium]|nr:hypothetical protein [Blastocatellia bacterium]
MLHSPLHRIIIGTLLAIIVLGVLRYKPWQEQTGNGVSRPREQLSVGFLPVT